MNASPTGRCSLVGAGPGDPELLTLKALRVMRSATVLLVDDLVSEAIVELALRERIGQPRVVHVGKRGGCASTPQAFIERLMVSEAQRGEHVVRLKGGDPYVFGRGGEEVQTLRRHGIEVEVVNGITAGLAAATALGAPLTHRDHAQGVVFVTGHAQDGGRTPNWPALAALAADGLTVVVYMGVARIESLQRGLLAGLPGDTPAGIVSCAGRADERRCIMRLDRLADTVHREQLASPAIVIVGDVLRTADAAVQRLGIEMPTEVAA